MGHGVFSLMVQQLGYSRLHALTSQSEYICPPPGMRPEPRNSMCAPVSMICTCEPVPSTKG